MPPRTAERLVYEIYAYGNTDSLNGIFNALAAIMAGADYLGLLKTAAITGVLVAALAGLLTPGRFHGWGWLLGFMLVYQALFLPRVTVAIIDRLGSQPPAVVDNVPLGIAFFGHYTSLVGDVLTTLFETAFQVIPRSNAQLPSTLTYQKNGVLFGDRLIATTRGATLTDPQLRTDLISYLHNCTFFDLQDGTLDPNTFTQSPDLWTLMGNPNPARFSSWGSPVQIDTCPKVYAALANRLPGDLARLQIRIAAALNPALDAPSAQGLLDDEVLQAYAKTQIATAAQGAADLLRQNVLINLVQDTATLTGQKLNDPAAVMLATAKANATAATNAGFLTLGRLAAEALPLVRNAIEAVIYAVFPFVLLILLLAQGRGLALALRSFLMTLVWIQLWPPLYAVLNYVATLASARNLAAAARMGDGTQGLSLDTAAAIYQGALSDQAIAGYLVVAIPVIASALLKGGEVAFQAVTGVGALQSAATGEAASATKGLISGDVVTFDQQQLAPSRSSAFMHTTQDVHGTTLTGSGPDTGVLRYQATLSRLASTFTLTARQASAVSAQARDASAFATTQREALQQSQVSALTHALGIQDSYERSHTRTGATQTGESRATSSQFQTLNSVAKDVNRHLGLHEDSTLGTSVTAAASVGAKLPFTLLGAQATAEGRQLSQETLQSAYDFARRASESAQISAASALVKQFQSSDAWQWAHGNRTGATPGYESASREVSARQTTTDKAYSQLQELTRTAQFMREWSQGTQTDFTNYAARRLAERGLLQEEDPVKLQRAVTDIAYSYARGGEVATGYVPPDSPLGPTRLGPPDPPTPSDALRTSGTPAIGGDSASEISTITRAYEATIHARQTRAGVSLGQPLETAPAAPVGDPREQGRQALAADAARLSAEHRAALRAAQAGEHLSSPAVWDTLGAHADLPTLGEPTGRDTFQAPPPTTPRP